MNLLALLILVIASRGQRCGSQIFGGQPPPPNGLRGGAARGGILNPPRQMFGHERKMEAEKQKQRDRIRLGPIVFDPEVLEFDDNDDYARDEEDQSRRPALGLDLSTIFVPLVNFAKLTGKSFETFFSMLEKQANLLLGRKTREGSISVTIVIIISWLVIALVVYALAQFAILRRMTEAEEDMRQIHLATPPTFTTTPPSPRLLTPDKSSSGLAAASEEEEAAAPSVKAIWLPSVGALQLSESSILKRRESVKRKRRMMMKRADRSRIRHRSSNVDHATAAWIEAGLDRIEAEDALKRNVLLKWHGFIKQHLMRDFAHADFQVEFGGLAASDLPKVTNLDVEMSDEQSLIVTMDLEAGFEADVDIVYLGEVRQRGCRLEVSNLKTRLEVNLVPQLIDENTVHVRQTGHVDLEVALELPDFAKAGEAGQLVRSSIIDALKNVDCDLPPLTSICNNDSSEDTFDGVFVESPSSYSIPQNDSCDSEDHLHVTLVKATLKSAADIGDLHHPYVILEMDHPAQRFHTSLTAAKKAVTEERNSSLDFHCMPRENSQFHFVISRQKTLELLVELWDSDRAGEEAPKNGHSGLNLSPATVGHRFLGLCLVSVQDLMLTPSQSHVVSLQGRPFEEDLVQGTLTLKFKYVPDSKMVTKSTFEGIHKSLEMKQCVGHAGQPVFITSATYAAKNKENKAEEEEGSKENISTAVAMAAVRDLQAQRNLRLGTPPATKSILVIRSIQRPGTPSSITSRTLVDAANGKLSCDDVEKSEIIISGEQQREADKLAGQPSLMHPKKPLGKAHKRRGFLATLKMRLSSKKAGSYSRESSSMPSYDLSSSVIEEDDEQAKDSDSGSTCSGRSSCCSEQSYQLNLWKGALSTSWQSLNASSSSLLVPANEDASSLSDASGISLSSVSGAMTGTPPGGKKNPTALILETVDDEHGLLVHYLIPDQLAKKGRLFKRKGLKLHVCQDHLFAAKHIKSGANCAVCLRKIMTRLGKKCYVCRDCGYTCHKGCYNRVSEPCSQSTLDSMELLRGSTLLKKRGT